jgi:Carboxypeptidase regulatory-like domain
MLRLLKRCAIVFLLSPATGVCWNTAVPCARYWEADAVFTGLALDDGLDHQGATWGNRPARLVVEQIFFGLQEEKEVEVDPGITTECYFRFRKGQRYFIYAKRDASGGLRTSGCLGSFRLDMAEEDLQFARRVARDGAASLLFGSANANNLGSLGPLAGVEILASGQGKQYRVVTDAEGHFTISPVAAGKYEVRAARAGYVSEEPVYTREVHSQGCAEVNVNLWTDGRISGTLRDSTGAPAPNIEAQLANLEEDGSLGFQGSVVSDEAGRFEFTKLAPGTYIFGINLDDEPSVRAPFSATRYPVPISLSEGQKLSEIDLRLPPRLPQRTIHVQAMWPDGRAADEVQLEGDCQWGRLETDADGRASFQMLLGQKCSISAKARISPGEYARSNTVVIPPGEHVAPVALVLH